MTRMPLKGFVLPMARQAEGNRGYRWRPFSRSAAVQNQLNAVFACFGSAVRHSQLFEEELERFLTAYNLVTSDSVTVEDMRSGKSIGVVVSRLRRYVGKQEKNDYFRIMKLLSTTLRERELLLHKFFLNREARFHSHMGRRRLIAELQRIEHNLDRSRLALNSMESALWRDSLSYLPATGMQDDSLWRWGPI